MKNNINKFFIAAVLVAFVLTSCTDEEDIINGSTKTNPKTNKVLVTEKQPYEICQYPEYDDNDYDETTMMHYIEDFDRLMRTGESEVQTYDLTKSVAVLELYYNYAVVDKQTSYDASIEYDPQIFEFTVPLYEGEVNVTELSDAYREFLNDVLETMGSKYLMYSNIYVENKTSNSVTFGLLTTGLTEGLPGMTRLRLLRDYSEVSIPSGLVLDWNQKPHLYQDFRMGNLAIKNANYMGVPRDFKIFNDKNILHPKDKKAPIGTFNTNDNQPDLVFSASDGSLLSAVNWEIMMCNNLINYDPAFMPYSSYYVCGVVPARYNEGPWNVQTVSISLSSMNVCKITPWISFQAFVNTLYFN